jgi:hypothetical protein
MLEKNRRGLFREKKRASSKVSKADDSSSHILNTDLLIVEIWRMNATLDPRKSILKGNLKFVICLMIRYARMFSFSSWRA